MKTNLSIVIVTWNNENDIEDCLISLFDSINHSKLNCKVIIVDNNSTDQTKKIVKAKFLDQVVLIENNKNRFLSPANNQGIKYAIKNYKPEFIMVLNPDTKVATDLITVLYKKISSDKLVCAIGPKIKFFQNKFEGKINSAGLMYDGFNQAYDVGFEEDDTGQYDDDRVVFGVTGTCIMFRTEAIAKAGFYWEKIKLYMDEIELFIRLNKLGYKTVYTGETYVLHKWMRSTDQNKIFKMQKYKNFVWLLIALRHYKLKSKLAMIKIYIKNLIKLIYNQPIT